MIYVAVQQLYYKGDNKGHVNLSQKKDVDKVVDSFDIEDLGNKEVYCRCWRSKKVGNKILELHAKYALVRKVINPSNFFGIINRFGIIVEIRHTL